MLLDTCHYRMVAVVVATLCFLLSTAILAQAQDVGVCPACYRGEEPFTADITRPGLEDQIQCSQVVAVAANLTNNTAECLSNQLTTFQGQCCDWPPGPPNGPDYCTLCENGSTNFNAEKIIPASAQTNGRDYTCAIVSTSVRYLEAGSPPGNCATTERGRSSAWCECEGIEPQCSLLCPGTGQAPPDLTLMDPIFKETCARFQYEFTTLTADECSDAPTRLNFDAQAFCCPDVEPPGNCEICPTSLGGTPSHVNKPIETELFGTVTCGELYLYASYLPNTENACLDFLFSLDLRRGQDCCDLPGDEVWTDGTPGGATPASSSSSSGGVAAMRFTGAATGFTVILGGVFLFLSLLLLSGL